MPIPVKLGEIALAMDVISEDWSVHLNPRTGELLELCTTGSDLLVGDEQSEQAEDWERVESEGWLKLPDQFEIHAWDIMRRFVASVEDPDQRAKLDNAIHGRGAFRMFKHQVREMGLEQDWYAFRRQALEEIAEAWLEEHEIPFIRDRPGTRDHDS